MTPYRHRQVGWKLAAGVIVGLMLAAGLVSVLSTATREASRLVYGLFGVLIVALLLFATLTVTVDGSEIRVVFGIGLVRKTIELADVIKCEPVGVRTLWGWGLHWTPGGWLYNVGGRDAVRIVLAGERAVIVGTDDVRGLAAAIEAPVARQRQESMSTRVASDPNCIFCKIVRGEIPSRKVYEDDDMFAFHDIQPQAAVHFMIIPKKHVATSYELTAEDAPVLGRILALAGRLAREQGATDGFRTIINTGRIGQQEVQHVHVHVIGGPGAARPHDPAQEHLRRTTMGGLSIWHWLIVLLVVVLIFGTKKLRNIGQDLGGAVKGFKEGMKTPEDAAAAPPKRRRRRRSPARRSTPRSRRRHARRS